MTASEFRLWMTVLQECPRDADGESVEAELAWQAMNAKVEALSYQPQYRMSLGEGLMWSSVFLAGSAVLVALIVA